MIQQRLTEDEDFLYIIEGTEILCSHLYDKRNILNSDCIKKYPNLAHSLDLLSGLVEMDFKGKKFNLFAEGINYELLDKKSKGKIFYSYEHINEIVKKYGINKPYYCIENEKEEFPLDQIDKHPLIDGKIIIFEEKKNTAF